MIATRSHHKGAENAMRLKFPSTSGRIVILLGLLVGSSARGESFEVTLSDPLYPNRPAKTYPVKIAWDKHGFPARYSFHLVAETCFDDKCKPLDATLQWDALGRYVGLSDSPRFPLTKKEHDPFGRQDYQRLDKILSDADSLLGRHPLEFFVPTKPAIADKVDAVTMPTPIAVQDAVVPGAAYTSWVLWRWVNGDIVDQLLARTRRLSGDDHLSRCLNSSDRGFVEFALRRLLGDGIDDPRHLRACYRVLENSGRANCELALKLLLDSASDLDEVHRKLIALIGSNGGSSRLILNHFRDLTNPSPEDWVHLAKQLKHISDYRDLGIAMKLLKRRASDSAVVRTHVALLLESDDHFVVMQAKEYLDQQNRENIKEVNR